MAAKIQRRRRNSGKRSGRESDIDGAIDDSMIAASGNRQKRVPSHIGAGGRVWNAGGTRVPLDFERVMGKT